jgi:hypothetical protein
MTSFFLSFFLLFLILFSRVEAMRLFRLQENTSSHFNTTYNPSENSLEDCQ